MKPQLITFWEVSSIRYPCTHHQFPRATDCLVIQWRIRHHHQQSKENLVYSFLHFHLQKSTLAWTSCPGTSDQSPIESSSEYAPGGASSFSNLASPWYRGSSALPSTSSDRHHWAETYVISPSSSSSKPSLSQDVWSGSLSSPPHLWPDWSAYC